MVEQVEKGELTYKQAQDRYGIQGRSTALVWLRKHGRMDNRRRPKKRLPALGNGGHASSRKLP